MPSLIVYGAFVMRHVDVMEGLRREGEIATPQNLPYLFGALTGVSLPPIVLSLVSLAALAVTLIVTIAMQLRAKTESARLWKMALGAELVLLVTMMVNKKSDTSYLAMCFFLLCAFVAFEADHANRQMTAFYTLLSLTALPIVSFWYWPLDGQSAQELHALIIAGDRNAWIMVAMQILLAASYLGLAFGILRCVRETTADRALKEIPMAAFRDSAS